MSNRTTKIIPLAAHIKPIKLPAYLYATENYATKKKQAVSTNKILRFPLLLQQNHQRYLNTASQSHLLYLQKIKNNLALFTTSPSSYRVLELLSPTTDPWLLDHRPVWTTPTLPGMCIIDGMARAVLQQHPNNKITKINNVRFYRWVIIDKPTELHYLVKKIQPQYFEVRLLSANEELLAAGEINIDRHYPTPKHSIQTINAVEPVANPYQTKNIFHGPAFQLLKQMTINNEGAHLQLRANSTTPAGIINPALFDATTHALAYGNLKHWLNVTPIDTPFPAWINELYLYADIPTNGTLACDVRYLGKHHVGNLIRFQIQLSTNQKLIAEFQLIESILKMPLFAKISPKEFYQMAKQHKYISNGLFSEVSEREINLNKQKVDQLKWYPHAIDDIYQLKLDVLNHYQEIAVKDFFAAKYKIHPRKIYIIDKDKAIIDGKITESFLLASSDTTIKVTQP